MSKYLLRRLLQAIPTFFGITLLSYALMLGAPGGPVTALTFNPNITPQEREELAARLGVDDPFPVQYVRWLLGDDWMRWDSNGDGLADHSFLLALDGPDGNPLPPGTQLGILRGDFGDSFFQHQPVFNIVMGRIPATLELGAMALLLSIIVGMPIGILAAIGRGRAFDNVTRVLAVLINAIPAFWLGLILILIFGAWLDILPMGSRCAVTLTGTCPPIYQRLNYLILPTIVLAAAPIASYSRFMRASMLETISKDYIRTAQAKGLSRREVWFRHGARNALIPLATFLGPAIAGLLGGAAVVETIFSWPGLGLLAVRAVVQQDYPIVMATVIIAGAGTLIGLLITDVLYAVIDPRIRFS
ncbi:MAG TPA: ABC transporter permease [Phototrophicaceae bacterium]|nr:ABC transporter permease [Phototrophicaceae bacterium]